MALNQASVQHWLSSEVFSFGWFVIFGTLSVAYTVWLNLLDKSRTKDILLIGSLAAVAFMMVIMVIFRQLWALSLK